MRNSNHKFGVIYYFASLKTRKKKVLMRWRFFIIVLPFTKLSDSVKLFTIIFLNYISTNRLLEKRLEYF